MTYPQCIFAVMIWREARSESTRARQAVACCVRKRVKHPAWWGHSYIDVITHRFQFSSIGDPHDPQLLMWPQETDPIFAECLTIAADVMSDAQEDIFPGSDSYFDNSIPPPSWATPDKLVGEEGAFRFYNIAGGV